MGTCKYCGQSAGFLRGKHAKCQQKYDEGKQQAISVISDAMSNSVPSESFHRWLKEITQSSYISDAERQALLLQGWEAAVERSLEDGIFDESEEKRLLELQDLFSLGKNELAKSNALSRVVKAAVIRDVLKGVIPQRATISESLSINFQKGEQIVWGFPNCEYLEDRTRRKYVGGSQGVSIRIMSGVYYRLGAFKGEAVDRTERVRIDTGWVVITDKHIYFSGPAKSLRISYAKILSFQPFSDGLGVIRDASSAKPQIFVTGDGWFTYNLVTNLARL